MPIIRKFKYFEGIFLTHRYLYPNAREHFATCIDFIPIVNNTFMTKVNDKCVRLTVFYNCAFTSDNQSNMSMNNSLNLISI